MPLRWGAGPDSPSRACRIDSIGLVPARSKTKQYENDRSRPRVRATELARLLGVTEPTIRKDIAGLEALGLLFRTHGGAVARGSMAEVDVHTRETKYLKEKQAIARASLALIRDGDSVFLDGGKTQYELAQLLANADAVGPTNRRGVKMLTNSFKVGEICQRMAEPPIVLADFVTICALGAVQTVVTDRDDEELSQWLDTANVELIVADLPGAVAGEHKADRPSR